MDLFQAAQQNEPLAARMRPRNMDEYIGQNHIVGKGRLLRRAIKADQLSSLIFYGPPGTGKTTLARVIAGTTSSRFLSLNAVLSGVKQVREAIAEAQELRDLHGRRTILFVDEVHRWNKAQQDALLPWVENGTIILVGATTENPYFEVNSALVSRSRIFQLKQLESEDLFEVARQAAADKERGYGKWEIDFEEGALEHLVKTADGDARSLLNSLQLAVETTPDSYPPPGGEKIYITLETAEESIQKKVVLYDKEGDYHYDTISAFIKSIRGSDPDAALYWMARMVKAGEDPRFIFRRMIISAAEDIGMADPQALVQVNAAAQAYDRVGLPEGQFHLTQAALYLATAPKSNSSLAFFDAVKVVDEEAAREVPNHLRDPSRDKHGFGHGEGYNYPHAYRDHWVAQAYLPRGLKGRIFYQPASQGFEAGIQQDVIRRRELQMAAMIEESLENLSFSPGDKERDAWMRRTRGNSSRFLEEMRSRMFAPLKTERHHKFLIWRESSGLLLWEAWRRVPEGGVCAWFPEGRNMDLCEHFTRSLPESERPIFFGGRSDTALQDLETIKESCELFETIMIRDWISRLSEENRKAEWEQLRQLLSPGGVLSLSEPLPAMGSRLSDFLPDGAESLDEWQSIREAEDAVYREAYPGLESEETVLALLKEMGASDSAAEILNSSEDRILSTEQLNNWFNTERPGSLGFRMKAVLGEKKMESYSSYCLKHLEGARVKWNSCRIILRADFQ
ncbi:MULTISPECIES: AAA family ATPase [unclassified Oceanispirochaeta]|uniref:AAA family ATPase n=1 Tax=unclassified Oceanispirochaeta TaxID=2635722 RepID=UPI000E096315|nr:MULTISPECIES: AAA family ATPase [unclassified Oceanispirochaeta]MBF9018339.1 AAA family ATPase [Oceanispirochaeta sp. M2]NPD74804.1 AAA family ATPase [Oceanispirochaeta sp. M1]RDG29357.1 AAA family ATPase [Oceanispirochaeta sp. M1]